MLGWSESGGGEGPGTCTSELEKVNKKRVRVKDLL